MERWSDGSATRDSRPSRHICNGNLCEPPFDDTGNGYQRAGGGHLISGQRIAKLTEQEGSRLIKLAPLRRERSKRRTGHLRQCSCGGIQLITLDWVASRRIQAERVDKFSSGRLNGNCQGREQGGKRRSGYGSERARGGS